MDFHFVRSCPSWCDGAKQNTFPLQVFTRSFDRNDLFSDRMGFWSEILRSIFMRLVYPEVIFRVNYFRIFSLPRLSTHHSDPMASRAKIIVGGSFSKTMNFRSNDEKIFLSDPQGNSVNNLDSLKCSCMSFDASSKSIFLLTFVVQHLMCFIMSLCKDKGSIQFHLHRGVFPLRRWTRAFSSALNSFVERLAIRSTRISSSRLNDEIVNSQMRKLIRRRFQPQLRFLIRPFVFSVGTFVDFDTQPTEKIGSSFILPVLIRLRKKKNLRLMKRYSTRSISHPPDFSSGERVDKTFLLIDRNSMRLV